MMLSNPDIVIGFLLGWRRQRMTYAPIPPAATARTSPLVSNRLIKRCAIEELLTLR